MPYCVVETVEDGEILCVAVPTVWLISENVMKWPGKSEYLKNFKAGKPPNNDWENFTISRILSKSIGKLN